MNLCSTYSGGPWRSTGVLRGSRPAGGKGVWLPAATDHAGTVLGQRRIDDKGNEIPACIPLPTGIDLTNTVITADAAHTQHANGTWLREHNAHCFAAACRHTARDPQRPLTALGIT